MWWTLHTGARANVYMFRIDFRISDCWRTAREGGAQARGGERVALKKPTTLRIQNTRKRTLFRYIIKTRRYCCCLNALRGKALVECRKSLHEKSKKITENRGKLQKIAANRTILLRKPPPFSTYLFAVSPKVHKWHTPYWEDSKGWSTVLFTALGSWGKPVPRRRAVNNWWNFERYREQLCGGRWWFLCKDCVILRSFAMTVSIKKRITQELLPLFKRDVSFKQRQQFWVSFFLTLTVVTKDLKITWSLQQ
jgi:hypothetical protein